jgi:hypothetical protein
VVGSVGMVEVVGSGGPVEVAGSGGTVEPAGSGGPVCSGAPVELPGAVVPVNVCG